MREPPPAARCQLTHGSSGAQNAFLQDRRQGDKTRARVVAPGGDRKVRAVDLVRRGVQQWTTTGGRGRWHVAGGWYPSQDEGRPSVSPTRSAESAVASSDGWLQLGTGRLNLRRLAAGLMLVSLLVVGSASAARSGNDFGETYNPTG